jgi:hypothetical protein
MNEGKRSRRWLLAALAACVFSPLVGSPALAACDIEDHCSGDPPVCTCPESPECVVGTIQTIPAGGTVDCDGIDIRIVANNGRIEVYDGFVTVRARDLRIDGGQAIRAFRSADNGIPFGVNVELTGTADIRGRVEANSSWGGGAVRIDTAGDMLFPNTGGGVAVEARGTLANAPGGEIELDSDGDIVIEEAIYADTPDGTYTGVAEGGDVEIRAAGTVTVDALIKVFGRETQAGSVRITSEGRIGANGLPLEDPEAVACGSADQTSKIVVDGNILAEGGNKNGHGGEIELTARRIEVNDKLSAQGGLNVGGGLSEGGSVQIAAGDCGVALNDQIDVTGGEGGSGMSGGAIVVESAGDVSVAAGALLNTRADANGGDGGGIIITAEGDLTIGAGATLDARGHTGGGGEGSGAPIDLRACNLSIAADVTIDSTGYEGGTVELTGREQVTIAASASVDATGPTDDDDGEIILRTPPGACAHDADLQCSASAECEHGCTSGTCQTQPPPGVCENNPLQSCTSNANCGSGCSTGTCLFGTCTNDTTVHCDTDAMCEDLGCQSGTCDVRHDTGGTTAQFDPPPQLEQDAGLAACG